MGISNMPEKSAQKTDEGPERTVEYWKKRLAGLERRIFEMVVFEQGLEERDRLTKTQVDFYIERRKNKKIA